MSVGIDELCTFICSVLNLNCAIRFFRRECEGRKKNSSGNLQWWCGLLAFTGTGASSESPIGQKWVPKDLAKDIDVCPVVPLVKECMRQRSEVGLDVNDSRLQPFSRLGWLEDTMSWFRTSLGECGAEYESMQQVKHFQSSCELKMRAKSEEQFYLKAIGKSEGSREVEVTACLADILPGDIFIRPLRCCKKRRLTLMNDYGETMWTEMRPDKPQPELLRSILLRRGVSS